MNSLTLQQIQEGYKHKKFSVSEIITSYYEKIERLNTTLNTFITVAPKENVIEKAKQFDNKIQDNMPLSPLFGIPIGYKDMFLTKGVKTTAASRVLENYIPAYSGTAVERLEEAGVISLGKLNCDAWAHGSSGENSDFGPTRNPWNPDTTPGGSSSGSAVAVAADMVPVAMGTDTGGSIRLPASFTNTVGLKPTYGLVSRYGVISMASSLDSIGHFTRTVTDNALVLSVTAGHDNKDATIGKDPGENYTHDIGKDIKGMRIGIPREYISEGLEKEVKENFEKTLSVFERLGAIIEEVSLPHTKYGIASYYIIQPAEVSSNLARFDGIRYGNGRSHFSDEAKRRIMLGTYTLSSGYYDAYYKKALKVRTLIKQDHIKVFEKYDILLSPVSPTLPWKLGEKINDPLSMYLGDALTVCANISGIPSLSVPSGFSENGLPIGVQLMGNYFSERKLYQAGFAFEQETKYYEKLPSI